MDRGLADLDELIIKCRSRVAREHLTEAVACYRTGAYRSAIVGAWIAVVFDILDKLRELQIAGDKNARRRVSEFEKLRRDHDVGKALEFERNILTIARDEFELVSPIQYDDLERLQEDRNRCAHPSMQTSDETYQPSAELARYHIAAAVEHLLSREPVQGQAAIERVFDDIRSSYFPTDEQNAAVYVRTGPLARAKRTLLRNVLVGLIKALLRGEPSLAERQRLYAAVNAILGVHRGIAESIMKEDLPKIIGDLEDAHWPNVVEFVRRVPIAWDLLNEYGQIKVRNTVETVAIESSPQAVLDALARPDLKSIAIARVSNATNQQLIALAEVMGTSVCPEYSAVSAIIFSAAFSFQTARDFGRSVILPYADRLTTGQLQLILEACVENNQIWGSYEIEENHRGTPWRNRPARG